MPPYFFALDSHIDPIYSINDVQIINIWFMTRLFRRPFVVLLYTLIAVLAWLPPAYATITITPVSDIDFAKPEVPSSPSSNLILPADGGNMTGTGTVIDGIPHRGQVNLFSTGGTSTISVDIQNISTGSGAVTLTNFTGIYDGIPISSFPQGALPLPGTGKTLYLGATLTYTNAVTDGLTLNPTFDLIVIYE